MANTWTTLLDVIYPTGSLYFSTNSTSPASKFGGTWTQIQDAFIAAKGSGYITGTVAAYSGDKAMTVDQMPKHRHMADVGYLYDNGWTTHSEDLAVPSFGGSAATTSSPWWYTWGSSKGGGQDFAPYYYSTYIWRRTA